MPVVVNPPITLGLLRRLPPSVLIGGYVAASLASAVFYGWLAWRLHKGEEARIVFRRAALWFSAVGMLASALFPGLLAIDFLAFQFWLAGLFLIPGFFKRFRWLLNDLLGRAPERLKNTVKERIRERYRASMLHALLASARSRWDRMPARQRRIVDLSISLCLVIFAIYSINRH